MLASTAPWGAIENCARIEFAVDFEETATNLNFSVIVRNTHQKEDGTGLRIGAGFEKVAQNEALIRHCHINSIAPGTNMSLRSGASSKEEACHLEKNVSGSP